MKPYFFVIFTPSYRRNSAGIRALHHLCHELNERGEMAFLPGGTVCAELNTPIFPFEEGSGKYALPGKKFIAVYPEVMSQNKYSADIVVRWLMSDRRSYFGGDGLTFQWEPWCNSTDTVYPRLWFPLVDKSIFYDAGLPRSGTCFYSKKNINSFCHEGVRNLADIEPGDWKALADVFRISEWLICEEHSQIVDEAAFCGCPSYGGLSIQDTIKRYEQNEANYPGMVDEFIRLCREAVK